jgi:NAD(P)H-hydrate epimerase
MAAIDRKTIAGGVPGIELMERAGTAMTEVLLEMLSEGHGHDHGGAHACGHDHGEDEHPSVVILCGKGNNGGDGLVMARLLAEEGCRVTVMLLSKPTNFSSDAMANFDLLPEEVDTIDADPADWPAEFTALAADCDVVVDAIFGTGITPPLRGPHADLIRAVNDSGIKCLAVDIPSGVSGDDGQVDPVAVGADVTVTVGQPKLGLLLAPGRDFAGEIEVVDVGFSEEICEQHSDDVHWLTRRDYLDLLPPRPGTIHKYSSGTVGILAGSRAFGGAAHLAGMGALRSGAGLVTVAVPGCLETATRVLLPEALTRVLPETDSGTIAPLEDAALEEFIAGQRALAVGPGMGADAATDAWLTTWLAATDLPLVLDADGLGAFGRTGTEPSFGTDQVVFTPHPGELARLVGKTSAEVEAEKLELVPELAARWNVVLMLKGSPSVIGAPDGRLFINASGDDALARGGSGDVLTGLIGGLLAQGMTALDAALLGAYVHGLAGTRAAEGTSTRGVLVREVAAALGPIFEALEKEASTVADLRERIWPMEGGSD